MTSPKRIKKIRFGLLSPAEIRKMSVTKVITADTYDDDGYPIDMGLMDPRLGVIDPGLRCRSCAGRPGECPGHFGHIELAAPVIHVGFARLIRKILRTTCRKCGRLLLDDKAKADYIRQIYTARQNGQPIDEIVKNVFKDAKAGTCPYCGEEQKEIKFEKPTGYIEDGHKLMPTDVRDRLEMIPDEDIVVFGMDPKNARPEWMVLTVLPVPPVTVRPSITLESGQRSEDDLTHKLVDIIRINQRFQENRDAGAPQLIIEDLWELLQYHVTTYMDNAVSGVPPARHRSGRPLKTLSQRLKGKEGRFRGSLSGKRVNFSARTVISPDPNLSINQVGVPERIAKEMTVPVTVTPFNIESVREYVRRGSERHPGANYVKRADGRRLKVTDKNCEELAEQLEVGWKVDRQLKEGDIVLFNRQPSLHRMSIMGHFVRVMPHKTFRLNPAVCAPYNADFDGDEMNLHVPQTMEALAEARILMLVQENILSPRFGGPIIGGLHDHVSGIFLLTKGYRRFNEYEAMDILRKTGVKDLPEPAIVEDGQQYWTGKQMFSQILPKNLNMNYKAKICENCEACKQEECERDAYVVIKDGDLKCGTIDEKAVGAFSGKIVDRIVKSYDAATAKQFIDDVTKLAIRSIMKFGFSFGISDTDIPRESKAQINDIILNSEKQVRKLIEAYDAGELEALPGRTLKETLEMRIMQELAKARDGAGSIAGKFLGSQGDNSAVIMARSGARGSFLNLTQVAGSVGQQSVRGERIMRGYGDRTLPHFQAGDLGADARGFVESSYKKGLNPTEFFFHAMGGREGLVDTAVRTSQSGYLQRRLVNALQDLEVKHDGTVRETRGVIVQFQYGEDGVDPMKSDYGEGVNVQRIVDSVVKGGD
ncbi:DNA-directed RNA polymerase subunit A' [Methanocella sp. CWC-04]|uniref:DNA-directed RNA polymerase subunit Rpo1N n=1 Tax=Methanooceanicella nereidis TaxID=2052831 RepID=A0AAP2RAJ3_9EURY|nr:DNA-directed RNA polymerase subunit A' [Methanocella sp. CWC-04]MCD1294001.1 DNA-directed RNA polymerase subunit A' [Methanocella sp. CWC-04]